MNVEQQPKTHIGQTRRQDLIKTAFAHIAERGFEGLKLRDVANEVGIDHSTLHYHFATKQMLVEGVVSYATQQFWDTLPESGSPEGKLHYHLEILAQMLGKWPALFNVLAELDLRAKRDPAVKSTIEKHEQGWRHALHGIFEQAALDGVFSEHLEPTQGAELVIATVKGAGHSPEKARAVLEQLERLIVRPTRSHETSP